MKGAEAAAEPIAKKTKVEDTPAPTPPGNTKRSSVTWKMFLTGLFTFHCNSSFYFIATLTFATMSCHTVSSRCFVFYIRHRRHD